MAMDIRYTVVMSEPARQDRQDAVVWFGDQVSTHEADRFSRAVDGNADSLGTFPQRCRLRPEAADARAFKVKPYQYNLWFDIDDDERLVVILAVIHQHLDPKTIAEQIARNRNLGR
jgi:plasmid stabilization system protein ParE